MRVAEMMANAERIRVQENANEARAQGGPSVLGAKVNGESNFGVR